MAELTPRQIREQAAYEARKAEKAIADRHNALMDDTKTVKLRETAADRRNFYRRQAGWPLLKEKNNV